MRQLLAILLVIVTAPLAAQAPVKNFTLTDVATGHPVSLDQYASSAAIVVLFTSNECPFDSYYSDRIAKMITEYQGKVQFLLINSHLDPEESEEKMKLKSSAWSAPYLADKDQLAMAALGAKRSPEAFVLRHEKTHFGVLYSGAIDDNAQEPEAVTQHHLRNALDKILSGKHTGHHQVRGAGCTIRKK
ncbi:MAG: redoxin domain-containing protein [Cyclobacteriaceae bacterium]|nr:redoxin domain-containing protein [Cyclobacteriaceae bacterium]